MIYSGFKIFLSLFQCVFRLIEHDGRELLVQSSDKQSMDEWTKAIAEVIRHLEMVPESEKKVFK